MTDSPVAQVRGEVLWSTAAIAVTLVAFVAFLVTYGLAAEAGIRTPQRASGHQRPSVILVWRTRRVIDQQDDTSVGVVLERRRQQRLADDPRLLLVGRDQDRYRCSAAGRKLSKLVARRVPSAINGALLTYAVTRFIGWRCGWEDIRAQLRLPRRKPVTAS